MASDLVGTQNAPQLSISVGDINGTQDGKFLDRGGVFTDYRVWSFYESDQHRFMAGMSSPNGFQGASVAFFQLAAPTLLWICRWTACRAGAPPIVPNHNPADGSWVLLDKHYEPVSITLFADGVTPLYRISGLFVYGHKNPDADTLKHVNFGRPPWIADEYPRAMGQFPQLVEKSIIDQQGSIALLNPIRKTTQ